MRLLKTSHDGNFSLTRFAPGDIPSYAILSHTWETDNQELTFQDIIDGAGRNKIGYRKVQFCGDQAKRDNLQYFWVDSCCIDKTSSAELSEAINSMFRWYQKATKCYVYLLDVSTGDPDIHAQSSQFLDESAFRQSRWFTRGWTLQELLAPLSVEFFSREGKPLGDRISLEVQIHDITGIAVSALRGRALTQFSVAVRMSWAEKRETTIEEDKAYSLLGIFDIHMPLIYGEGMKNAIIRLREEIDKRSKLGSGAQDSSEVSTQDYTKRKHESFSTVPFSPDPDFVDRPDILAWIRGKCTGPGTRAALVGLGGVGKSQLAIQYCHNVRDASPQMFIFWVHASTKARFEEAYRDIADRLELPERDNPKIDVLRLVSNWLCDEMNGQWTMILDNVDDVETFFPSQKHEQDEPFKSLSASLAAYLPQSRNGSILITSRNKDAATRLTGGYKSIKEVCAMDESQGLQLLRNKLQDTSTEEGAVNLLRALDYIPLAITQAAAYINRRARMTISGYLNEFRASGKKRENLLNRDAGDLRRDEGASNSVVTTWQMSFERIRQERRSAADLLSLMSFFNPQGIPELVLRRYSKNTAKLGDENDADSAFDDDFDILQAYSLITATAETNICEMHALVQFCTQVWLSSFSDTEWWKQKFVELMAREFPTEQFENWAKCRQLLPHIESLYDAKPATNDSLKEWAQILTNAARYIDMALGKYDDAERLNQRALEWYEKHLGDQHPDTLVSMNNLMSVLRHQGKYNEAEKLNRRVLEEMEKKLGVQHPDTLRSVSNLAVTLCDQGKHEEAERLNRRVLEVFEKDLGIQHPDTLRSVENLAGVLLELGKYNEAEKLNRRAMEGSEKELGEQHPDTLMSVNNLAGVLQAQGKYDEAEKLNRRALEEREKKLGVQHPDTLMSMGNLAWVLEDQGKYDEAEKLNRRALEGYEKELGRQHVLTLTSVNNLATVLKARGKYDEAEKLNRRVLEGREKMLGAQHPFTLRSVNNLASVLRFLGKYDEAEKLNRRALEEREKKLGVQHPDTLLSMSNLANVLRAQRKYDEAEKLHWRALEWYEKELGEQHPYALTSVVNLASVLQARGRYKEAEKLNRRALEGRKKELGSQHPDTLTSVSNLANVLQAQQQYDEAEQLSRRALEGYEKVLGEQHPFTLMSVSNLAGILQYQGKYSEAEKLNRRALEGRVKELGEQHLDTLGSVYCLAYLLHKRKQYVEASELYQRAYDGYEQKLGSQHPTVVACLNRLTALQQDLKHDGPGRTTQGVD